MVVEAGRKAKKNFLNVYFFSSFRNVLAGNPLVVFCVKIIWYLRFAS